MRILGINTTYHPSTGAIMKAALSYAEKQGHETYIATADIEAGPHSFCLQPSFLARQAQKVVSQFSGSDGFHCKVRTREFIQWVDSIQPDVVHIHNLHGYYINAEMLLDYLYEKQIRVIITMHDCWLFTGRCAYFDRTGCTRWQEGCGHCECKAQYPRARFIDTCKSQWLRKKAMLTHRSFIFVPPSKWLMNLAKASFLSDEAIRVIPNGTDILGMPAAGNKAFFNPFTDKKVLIAAAYPFTEEKGLSLYKSLASQVEELGYAVALVGADVTEPKQEGNLILLPRETSRQRYIDILSSADAYVALSKQENYPTVLMEAAALGLPAISFDVGGSAEIIEHGKTGFITPKLDLDAVIDAVRHLGEINPDECKAYAQRFDYETMGKAYYSLYIGGAHE